MISGGKCITIQSQTTKDEKSTILPFLFLLLGCRRVADFDFDTQTQSLTINDGYFYDICFENDSVTSDGKLYEGALLLIWEDSTCVPPKKLN